MGSDSELSAAPSSTINGYFQKTPSVLSAPARRTRNFNSKRPVIPPKQKKTPIHPTTQQSSKTARQPPTKKPRLDTSQASLSSATLPAKYVWEESDNHNDLYEDRDNISEDKVPTNTDSNLNLSSKPTVPPSAYKRPLTSGI